MSRLKTTLKLGAAFATLLAVTPAMADGEYGVLMKTLANPFWGAMGAGVEAGAQEAGDQGAEDDGREGGAGDQQPLHQGEEQQEGQRGQAHALRSRR